MKPEKDCRRRCWKFWQEKLTGQASVSIPELLSALPVPGKKSTNSFQNLDASNLASTILFPDDQSFLICYLSFHPEHFKTTQFHWSLFQRNVCATAMFSFSLHFEPFVANDPLAPQKVHNREASNPRRPKIDLEMKILPLHNVVNQLEEDWSNWIVNVYIENPFFLVRLTALPLVSKKFLPVHFYSPPIFILWKKIIHLNRWNRTFFFTILELKMSDVSSVRCSAILTVEVFLLQIIAKLP